MNKFEQALSYAEAGIPVFPCQPNGKEPLTPHGFKDATTDAEQVEKWWDEYPDANIGSPLGVAGGIGVTIDIDGAENTWPEDTEFQFSLDKGIGVRTPGGGFHYHFSKPDGMEWKNTTSNIAPKVDTRADGGYVILPHSEIDGKQYAWLNPKRTLDDLEQPDTRITNLLNTTLRSPSEPAGEHFSSMESVPEGQRNSTLFRRACYLRRGYFDYDEILNTISVFNESRCKPPLDINELRTIAESACKYEPDAKTAEFLEASSGDPLEQPPILYIDISKLLNTPAPPMEYIFDGMIPRGTLIGIDAQGGLGKSMLMQQLIVSAATGLTLLESFVPTEPMKILWLQGEDPEDEIHRRFEKILRAFDISHEARKLCEKNIGLQIMQARPLVKPKNGTQVKTKDCNKLMDDIREYQPDILVLDPRSSFYAGDENDNNMMAHFMGVLREITQITERGTSIIGVHHVSKAKEGVMDSGAGRGATAARDAQRATFGLVPLAPKEITELGIIDGCFRYVFLGHTKANMSPRTSNQILLRREIGINGGVLKEVSSTQLRQEEGDRILLAMAEKIPELIGDNTNNLSVHEWSKGKDDAQKLFKEQLKESTNGKLNHLKAAFELSESYGYIVIESLQIEGVNKPKRVPRAKQAELANQPKIAE